MNTTKKSGSNFTTPANFPQYDYSKLPQELKVKRNFVLHKDKVPYQAKMNGYQKAKPNDESTWADFSTAVAIYQQSSKFSGIGYVFDGTGIVGVDVDHCITPCGDFTELSKGLIAECDSYTEYSPSRNGIHIYIKETNFQSLVEYLTKHNGEIGTGKKFSNGVEIYFTGRYFTLTGLHLENTPTEIKERSGLARKLIERFNGKKTENTPELNLKDSKQQNLSDEKIIGLIKNSKQAELFDKLFSKGDISDYSDDDSSADLALMNILAFWTNKDPAQMERIFSQSALARREKWQRQGYRDLTIDKAINDVKNVFGVMGEDKNINSLELTPEIVKSLLYYHCTDLGNAERLTKCYGKKFFYYINDYGRWLTYSAPIWTVAANSQNSSVSRFFLNMAKEIQRHTKPLIESLDEQYRSLTTYKSENGNTITLSLKVLKEQDPAKGEKAEKINNEKVILEKMNNYAKYEMEKRKCYNSAVETVKCLPEILIQSEQLNTDDMLLNTPTGIVDLTTGKLHPHNSKYLFTQCTGAEYRQGYRNPLIEQFFLDVLPDDEDREAFLLYVGYSLTGLTKEEKALILTGRGRNGKGVTTTALLHMFGCGNSSFATTFKIDSLLQTTYQKDGDAPSPEIAKLQHKRCAISEEIPESRKLNAALFKQLTGGDLISARRLHCDPFNIKPKFKMILSGNYLPEIGDANDIGLRERLMIIPFTQSFTGDKCNPNLKTDMLKPDAQCGLLSLLVDCCIKYQKSGLLVSKNMNDFKSSYLQENDTVGSFIAECCKRDNDSYILRREFIQRFHQWQGNSTNRLTDTQIVNAAKHIDGISYRRITSGYAIYGVKWANDTSFQDFEEYNNVPLPNDDDDDHSKSEIIGGIFKL